LRRFPGGGMEISMHSPLSTSRVLFVLLGGAVALAVPAVSNAQQAGNKKDLDAAYSGASRRFSELATGSDKPDQKGDANVTKACAQWYIYRITHRESFDPVRVQKEFADKVDDMLAQKPGGGARDNRAFIRMFGPALAAAMSDVMAINSVDKNPATVIQASMMMSTMAKLKDDGVTAYLVKLLKDTNTDPVVRLYVFKALKEAMPITQQPDVDFTLNLDNPAQNAKRKLDADLVNALTAHIEGRDRKITFETMTPEELAAVRYVRREAIIALAQAGSPAVLAVNKKQVKKDMLEGAVAPTLCLVLAGALQPAPSLQEKVEAAIGLCNLRFPNMIEYDPAVAKFLIGRTIVEFVDHYNTDLGKISAEGADRRLPYVPYKSDAKRLKEALIEFEKNAKAKELRDIGEPLLDSFYLKATAKTPFPQPANQYLNDLKALLPRLRPANGNVFKTLKAPVIPLN
jgi:hypothetical protein